MSRRPVAAFLRAPLARKLCAIEAAICLAGARGLTALPARWFGQALPRVAGAPIAVDADAALAPASAEPTTADPVPSQRAREIGATVGRVARAVPFRAHCLEQALAARWMLARRDCPAVLHLGVNGAAAARAVPERGAAAHAWVSVGSEIVLGDGDLTHFAVIARFG